MPQISRPCLYVCTACRTEADIAAGRTAPIPAGTQLYDAIRAKATLQAITVQPVLCMANCEQGCSVAIAQPGKWGYLLGRLCPTHFEPLADDLLIYAKAYAETPSGTVMRKGRPASLHHAIIARFPVPAPEGVAETFLTPTVS